MPSTFVIMPQSYEKKSHSERSSPARIKASGDADSFLFHLRWRNKQGPLSVHIGSVQEKPLPVKNWCTLLIKKPLFEEIWREAYKKSGPQDSCLVHCRSVHGGWTAFRKHKISPPGKDTPFALRPPGPYGYRSITPHTSHTTSRRIEMADYQRLMHFCPIQIDQTEMHKSLIERQFHSTASSQFSTT